MSIDKVGTIEVIHVCNNNGDKQVSDPFKKDVFQRSDGSISCERDKKPYICHRGGCYSYTGRNKYTLTHDDRMYLIVNNNKR